MTHRLTVASVVVVCAAMSTSGGCSNGPARIHPPAIDASAAGQGAIDQYDANKDGAISGDELDKAPALKAAIRKIDADGDRKLTAGEVTDRIKQWQDSKLGLTTARCTVHMDGKPLADATVTLVPEGFLGPNVPMATGKTDANGNTSLSVANPPEPGLSGVAPGLYRVEISKKVDGNETVPPQYNTATTLGLEVAIDTDTLPEGAVAYDLKSK